MPSLGAALFLSYAPNDSAWHGSLVAQVLTLPSLGSHMGGHVSLVLTESCRIPIACLTPAWRGLTLSPGQIHEKQSSPKGSSHNLLELSVVLLKVTLFLFPPL